MFNIFATLTGKAAMEVAEYLYSAFLRALVKAAIDDPETTWDDQVMAMLDDLFDYEEN